ncbi:MAG: endonuclease/exonuclease/phosphatase family protein [Bacteroidetes bacterium]|nr:endonuclease/exonuclease/phosphatase family protein [Bacteroidota bacterium]
MNSKTKILSLLFLVITICLTQHSNAQKQAKVACIGFYNLENFYDTINEPDVNDEEFTPDGPNRWNTEKYNIKLKHMSEAISQIGDELVKGGPVIMGFSEIENRSVLEDLIKQPALKAMNYGIVHYDSPDRRGVDVGLIYQKQYFKVTTSYAVKLTLDGDTSFRTRDQLVVYGLFDGEPVCLIVNHWPSRSGGEKISQHKRIRAADVCRSIADSVMKRDPNAKIFIMGDLNDDPSDISLLDHLKAKKTKEETKQGDLYNPMYRLFKDGIGSLAYRDSWNLFDQIIVSYPLIEKDKSTYRLYQAKVFNRSFLTQKEGQYSGYPLRTYVGTTFVGGYSDHFPVYVFLVKEK